jgi:DNA primase
MKGRYVFPIFDQMNEDRIIGFTGRRVDKEEEMKWKHLSSKSLFIFGDPDECESTHRVILVESIGDLLKLREHGVKDVLCLFGVSMSQAVLAKIIALNPASIIISTNRDKAKVIAGVQHYVGQEAAEKIRRTLSKFFDESAIQIVFPPEREGQKDWGTATVEEIKLTFEEKT